MTSPHYLLIAAGAKSPTAPGWNDPDRAPDTPRDGMNLGLRLDGMTVVDCDGAAAVDWWETHGDPLAEYVSESRPGHRAYWYRGEAIAPGYYHWVLPDGTRGGEVRSGHRVQCVVPPSSHPLTGEPYRWLGTAVTDIDALAPYPTTLPPPADERKVPGKRKPVTGAPDVVEWLPNQWCPAKPVAEDPTDTLGHHSPGLAMGVLPDGRFVPHCYGGCDRADVIAALVESGDYDRDDLWPADRDALQPWDMDMALELAEAQAPLRQVDDAYPEFPIDALPPLLQELVLTGSRTINCPPEYLGAPALAILGAALGRDVRLKVKSDWSERAAIWVAVVGGPGERKSPAIKPLMGVVYKEQIRLREDHLSRLEAEKANAKADKRQPAYVPCGKTVVSDFTMEALHRVLDDNPGGVLMHQDELTGWLRGMDAYRGGQGADRANWLKMWDGQTVDIVRRGGEAAGVHIPHPFIGIVGGIQPGVLHEIGGGRDDGLIERFLFARGAPRQVTSMVWDGLDDDILDRWASLWHRVRSADQRQVIHGRTITLDADARDAMSPFYVRCHDLANVPAPLAAVWSKMTGQVARLALILSQIGPNGPAGVVDGYTMRQAIRLADYFMGQARMLLTDAPASHQEVQHVQRIEALKEWLARHPEATKRDILQKGPRWARRTASLDPVLADLRDSGALNMEAS